MTDIDVDLSGLEDLQSDFEELEQRGTSDAVFEVVSTAEYSAPIEYGRGPITVDSDTAIPIETEDGLIFRQSVSGHPPYPFFRPALREFEANPKPFVAENTGESLDNAVTMADAIEMVALSLETQIKLNATAQASGRSPGTHPDHPQVVTGNLRNGIRSRRIR